jgi:hypothetical protein
VLIAVVALWTSRGPEEMVLRDDATSAAAFVLHPAEIRNDGGIALSWSPMAGADRYQVRVYGPDLSEVYRSPDVAETSLLVDRSALPTDLPPALDLTWRVYGLSEGDIVGLSAPGSIRTP